MLGMSVKNFDKKPLTITWEIREENLTTGQTISLEDTYTKYYGDAMPTPSPSCPWGSGWTSVSIYPYPPARVTESATYTMTCQYEVQQYIITWEVIEKNLGTGETRVSSQNFACNEGDTTPVPNLPSVNPWDGNPWTSSSIDPVPPLVTGNATYDAVFTYDPVVIPTGFSMASKYWGGPIGASEYDNFMSFTQDNPPGCAYGNTGISIDGYYIYNNEYAIGAREYQNSNWEVMVDLVYFGYTVSGGVVGFTPISTGCLGPRNNIGYEYDFWYSNDRTFINQKYGGDLDAYVVHLFKDGILSLS